MEKSKEEIGFDWREAENRFGETQEAIRKLKKRFEKKNLKEAKRNKKKNQKERVLTR